MESGGIALLIPSPMVCMGREDSKKREAAGEGSFEEKTEHASSACHHSRRVNVAARTVLADLRAA